MKKIRMQTIVFLASFVLVMTLVDSVARGGIVFLDDFEDGSATDGAPVTWTPWPGATGSFEVIDGDFVMTRPSNNEEMYCYVDKYMTLADTSIRTQARLIGSTAWWLGLLARGNTTPTMYALLLFNNGRLEIWRFGPTPGSSWILAGADVGIDPRAQYVLLRFDAIGNELSAWAWREGDPMPAEPQVTAVHSELATGVVGIAADLGWRLSNNDAIFRYVEVYESISLSSDFNRDGIVDAADMCIMIDHWGENYPLCDIGPEPWGDGIIDVQDLIVLAEHLFEDYRLIAHWQLDETDGNIAYDSVGGHDATIQGESLWQPTGGHVVGALELDGIDDYVSTPFILNPRDGSFSAFAWLKGGGPDQVAISQTGDLGQVWLCVDSSGNIMTRFSEKFFGALVSEKVIKDGQWHHVGFIYDMDSFHRLLYVDGVLVAEDATVVAFDSSDGGIHIGASKDIDAGTFFSGLIDDVRIYNVALNAEQIAALAQ